MGGEPRLKATTFRRIVVVRALSGLGDMLCAIPVFRALRRAYSDARISLVGLQETKPLMRRFAHYLDEWLEFPGFPGIPERTAAIRQLPRFLAQMHERRFDLALQLHGNGRITNIFTILLGARISAGFHAIDADCPDTGYFFPYPDHLPEVRRGLHLLQLMGVPLAGEHLEFPLGEDDFFALRRLRPVSSLLSGQYVCIHPGASSPAKRWAPDRFARLADWLAGQGLRVVLTGSSEERAVTRAVANSARSPCVDLAGMTELGTLAALLQRAKLLVCNDTGTSHLAAALRVPSVVLFSASDPARWAPLDRGLHEAIDVRDRHGEEGLAEVLQRLAERLNATNTLSQRLVADRPC